MTNHTPGPKVLYILRRMPCRAGDVPKIRRAFLEAERGGFAVCGEDFIWTATPKGHAAIAKAEGR